MDISQIHIQGARRPQLKTDFRSEAGSFLRILGIERQFLNCGHSGLTGYTSFTRWESLYIGRILPPSSNHREHHV